jgi:hypothetical protein
MDLQPAHSRVADGTAIESVQQLDGEQSGVACRGDSLSETVSTTKTTLAAILERFVGLRTVCTSRCQAAPEPLLPADQPTSGRSNNGQFF